MVLIEDSPTIDVAFLRIIDTELDIIVSPIGGFDTLMWKLILPTNLRELKLSQ
jgi:hypothetical protein